MEKLKAGFAAKAAAVILFVLSAMCFAASAAGVLAMDAAGVYRKSEAELLNEGYDSACDKYSIVAMAGYQDDFNKELLEQTNFRYGIVRAKNIDDVDLEDSRSYLMQTFGKTIHADDLRVFMYEIDPEETPYFTYGENLWDNYAIHADNRGYRLNQYPIEGYYYNRENATFYARSGKNLFLEEVEFVQMESGERLSIDECVWYNGEFKWEETCRNAVTVSGEKISMDKIAIMDTVDLNDVGEEHGYDYMENGSVYITEKYKPKLERYYVVASVRLPLQGEASLREGDMFIQVSMIVGFMYRMRFVAIAVLAASLLVLAGSFVFLMSAAGHHKNKKGVTRVLLDYAPLDLYFAGACMAEYLFIALLWSAAAPIVGWRSLPETLGYLSFWILAAGSGVLILLVFLAFCMSLAVNIKLGKWWRRSAVYWIWKKGIGFLRCCCRLCIHLMAGICKGVSLCWKVCIALGMLACLEFFTILVASSDTAAILFFWLLEKAIVYPLVLYLMVQMLTLQKGAQRIAGGELGYRIRTDRMFWELKKHGNCLNDIGIGMNAAVNERLKSERFKTELITNVSHDIKTPLTSIINYVDLLQKEQIGNPTAQEYLEVLKRQSARLKKLIEDLIEASKASSGSMNVVMEKCDAGVMLIQTVGEFEEKLMAEQILLQIKKPDAPVLIEADSRHLWRVFDNLMNNICKYAQPMTRAYINLELDGAQALITFRNISRYQLNISSEELMERFVRADSSRNTEGNGLGISIAKSLTELMNGKFDLVVDGDLFKVVLRFPLYGAPLYGDSLQHPQYAGGRADGQNPRKPVQDAWAEQKPQSGQHPQFGPNNWAGQHPQAGPNPWIGQNAQPGQNNWAGSPGEPRNRRGFPAAEVVAGIQNVGMRAKTVGNAVTDKTGRVLRQAGRFAKNIKWAAQQAKEETAAEARERAVAKAAKAMEIEKEKALEGQAAETLKSPWELAEETAETWMELAAEPTGAAMELVETIAEPEQTTFREVEKEKTFVEPEVAAEKVPMEEKMEEKAEDKNTTVR